eukprot:TRINITY_DN1683_c0_g1_i1.p1 TRINITY_DN1683_c0_g1~~TRINITY_DN1683_c0_g1_i1.p1  ORF type:complete len:314 (+),score=68.52 TRINITY_DN1683_c0_g1_i1:39-944(+)
MTEVRQWNNYSFYTLGDDSDIDNIDFILFFFHGLGAHTGANLAFLNSIYERYPQCVIYSLDLYGHGLSADTTSGVLHHIDDTGQLLSGPLEFIFEMIEGRDSVPMFVMGTSMGGAISLILSHLLHEREIPGFKGAILLAPALDKAVLPGGLTLNGLKLFNNLFGGKLRIGPEGRGTGWKTKGEGPHTEWEWRNEEDHIRASEDQYSLFPDKIRISLVVALSHVIDTATSLMGDIEFPVLLFHGSGDAVIDHQSSSRFFEIAKSEDKEFILLPKACHNLTVDPDAPIILENIFRFIDNKIHN